MFALAVTHMDSKNHNHHVTVPVIAGEPGMHWPRFGGGGAERHVRLSRIPRVLPHFPPFDEVCLSDASLPKLFNQEPESMSQSVNMQFSTDTGRLVLSIEMNEELTERFLEWSRSITRAARSEECESFPEIEFRAGFCALGNHLVAVREGQQFVALDELGMFDPI